MVIKTVAVEEFSAHLGELLSLLKEGTEIVLTEGDKPLARIVPVEGEPGNRTPGLLPGSMQTTPDFDEPLPDQFWLGEDE
jgi:antitoxin (DNA-binding transcriptional repressor) of toxin-antitoxin stability system